MGSPYILWEMKGNTLMGLAICLTYPMALHSCLTQVNISNGLSKPIFLSNLDSKPTKSSSNSLSIYPNLFFFFWELHTLHTWRAIVALLTIFFFILKHLTSLSILNKIFSHLSPSYFLCLALMFLFSSRTRPTISYLYFLLRVKPKTKAKPQSSRLISPSTSAIHRHNHLYWFLPVYFSPRVKPKTKAKKDTGRNQHWWLWRWIGEVEGDINLGDCGGGFGQWSAV